MDSFLFVFQVSDSKIVFEARSDEIRDVLVFFGAPSHRCGDGELDAVKSSTNTEGKATRQLLRISVSR